MADEGIRSDAVGPLAESAGGDAETLAWAALLAELGIADPMAIDPRRLRPTELIRMLNSGPLGEVLEERRLNRHRNQAGWRIGDEKSIDLVRYTAWMMERPRRRIDGEDEDPTGLNRADPAYAAHKERARRRQQEKSIAGRDIGELPAVADPQRRAAGRLDFGLFCTTYFPQIFLKPFCDDHRRAIALFRVVVLEGGQFALAMPRGMGKTVLCECAALWALLYGHHRFCAVIGPDEDHARQRTENIRVHLETNDQLAADFPEVCVPIRRLDGITQRRLLYRGEVIRQELTAKRIMLPVMPESAAAGAMIATAGITGQIRGLSVTRADGQVARPSLVIIDDPQTDESAHSPSQCAQREAIVNGAILGLAGPGARISAIMPCTVVRADDLADRVLDHQRNPQWQGTRTKLVYAWAKNEKLWDQYRELRLSAQREHIGRPSAVLRLCNAFYAKHRKAMDAGAVVAWAERHNDDELSALEHAWNLRIDRKDAAFFAEYQNEPIQSETARPDLTADEIAAKLNGHARGLVPVDATLLTAFVDVQKRILFWVVVAWRADLTGYVVDYGTEPDQRAGHFSAASARITLAQKAPGSGLEGSLYAGMTRVADALLGREWKRDAGGTMRIEKLVVDANWPDSTNVVYQFCRQSEHAALLLPSHGVGITAGRKPMGEWPKQPGDRVGLNWRVPAMTAGKRQVRKLLFDTNFWKTTTLNRLAVPMGAAGCLSLFGRRADHHRLFAEHLTSEYRVETTGRGRGLVEWKALPNRDNHWWDCLVGTCVAASVGGAGVLEGDRPAAKKQRMSYAERYRKWKSGLPSS